MKEFYGEDVFLENEVAVELYNAVKDLPIYDYHCHMSAKDIFEDKQFDNIGEMWLGGDHYKWRAMRQCGIKEELITGKASMHDKFVAFASILPKLPGSPIYQWAHMELKTVFGIREPLCADNAEEVWEKANKVIKERGYSPSKMLELFNVEVVCTTDDPIDDLEYHKKLKDYKTKVRPTYRPDRIMYIEKEDFAGYIGRLGADSFDSLLKIAEDRLCYFIDAGCKVSDHAVSNFPKAQGNYEAAKSAFEKKLKGMLLDQNEMDAYVDFMLLFFIGLYKKHDITMQLHMSPLRNANTNMFKRIGADTGFDTIGSAVTAEKLVDILDRANTQTGLPKMVFYSLNPVADNMIATVIGSFSEGIPGKMQLGSAWWFNDHVKGIERQLTISANSGLLGNFIGMLTDSRSFTSYVRFDYFRRILCSVVSRYVVGGEYPGGETAIQLVKDVCYNNVKRYIGI
ncbi:MAG: glucuronate isomerase [Clostridiaceae bacterium]|nr:glucuronate isomerase [Clostridiaceae bacterium]